MRNNAVDFRAIVAATRNKKTVAVDEMNTISQFNL
jgi:hypothetical protein